MAPSTQSAWTNESVLAFAGHHDPVEKMERYARDVALKAIDEGWTGPPFDPIRLAELLKIAVRPNADVQDARTVPVGRKSFRIEFNPTRPRARVRFSIAHEIAHTFFEDCGESIRHRHRPEGPISDAWQLEMLCNIAASEIIMPIGTINRDIKEGNDIETILEIRKKYDVSAEAVLIRIAKAADFPCAAFCASRRDRQFNGSETYKLDYIIPSRSWPYSFPFSAILPDPSAVGECKAIGYTAKGEEHWGPDRRKVRVECVGLPAYPGASVPRVAGLLRTPQRYAKTASIKYLIGSALEPRGRGSKIVAQVVNDRTPNWGGGGFAVAIRKKWPHVQQDFQNGASANSHLFKIGNSCELVVQDELFVFCIVGQKGYGPSRHPRIRYSALERGLEDLSARAIEIDASIHMPRIGTGNAGGSWFIIEELINEKLVRRGVPVTVYDLPARRKTQPADHFLDGFA